MKYLRGKVEPFTNVESVTSGSKYRVPRTRRNMSEQAEKLGHIPRESKLLFILMRELL